MNNLATCYNISANSDYGSQETIFADRRSASSSSDEGFAGSPITKAFEKLKETGWDLVFAENDHKRQGWSTFSGETEIEFAIFNTARKLAEMVLSDPLMLPTSVLGYPAASEHYNRQMLCMMMIHNEEQRHRQTAINQRNRQQQQKDWLEMNAELEEVHTPGIKATDRVLVQPTRAQIRRANKHPISDYCQFCFNNERAKYEKQGIAVDPNDDGPWRNHKCKNNKGEVICPILFSHTCKFCGKSGKWAHTQRYCPVQQQRKFDRTTL